MENKNNKKYDTQLKIAVLVLAIIFTAKDFVPYFPVIKKYIAHNQEIKEREEKWEKEKTIPKYEYYPDGVLKSKWHNGTEEYYRRNGVLKYIEKGDITEEYNEEGKLITSEEEEKESRNGEYKAYSPDGNILLDYNYKNGKFDGVQKVYFYNSDKLYSEREYKEDVPVGIHKTYYKNGNPESVTDYSFEKNKKMKIDYYVNGNIQKKEIFSYSDEDKEISEYQEEYNSDGQLTSKITRKGKLKTEEIRSYYDNKNPEYIIYYKNGKKQSVGKEYYENGQLKTNQYYDEKSQNLVAEQYYDTGVLLSKTIYNGKDMYGEMLYYTENRADNSRYYEMKREGNKKTEKFFDRSGNVVYENSKEIGLWIIFMKKSGKTQKIGG